MISVRKRGYYLCAFALIENRGKVRNIKKRRGVGVKIVEITNLEDTILNSQDGHIESSTSQIEDEDVTFSLVHVSLLLVQTVCDSGSRGLVDDSQDVESSDHSGILGGLREWED